jgi:4-aminobutyrate aminotransferase and related aminotransferases
LTQTTSPLVPTGPSTPSSEARVRADDRSHVFHSWSAQAQIDPLPIASASGSYFSDYSGKRYLDFSSQLVNVNIGYQHPKLVAAIQEQAAKLCTIARLRQRCAQ